MRRVGQPVIATLGTKAHLTLTTTLLKSVARMSKYSTGENLLNYFSACRHFAKT
jgi:hypothetical protein